MLKPNDEIVFVKEPENVLLHARVIQPRHKGLGDEAFLVRVAAVQGTKSIYNHTLVALNYADEGDKWSQGWHSDIADALRTARALSPAP